MWKYNGTNRPDFAVKPGPGQESVWDYPRPPKLSPDQRNVVVKWNGQVIASSNQAVRILETASPPTFYLPPKDVNTELLTESTGSSFCEWKGKATYWDITVARDINKGAAWSYDNPTPAFSSIAGYYSFYPARVNCTVGGETVKPQPGNFYGGWMTPEIVGPVKGEPGSGGW
ncbi:MAG: DUF427 domain-containing protein [Balneolaceae bacterium]